MFVLYQFNKLNQAVIEGSNDGAVLHKLVQTLPVDRLGSYKVQLVTVTLVNSRTPERRTQSTKNWTGL